MGLFDWLSVMDWVTPASNIVKATTGQGEIGGGSWADVNRLRSHGIDVQGVNADPIHGDVKFFVPASQVEAAKRVLGRI